MFLVGTRSSVAWSTLLGLGSPRQPAERFHSLDHHWITGPQTSLMIVTDHLLIILSLLDYPRQTTVPSSAALLTLLGEPPSILEGYVNFGVVLGNQEDQMRQVYLPSSNTALNRTYLVLSLPYRHHLVDETPLIKIRRISTIKQT